jgi:chromosome segregation ATPase
MTTKKSKIRNYLQNTLVEISKSLKGLKFNPNHDSSSGRFSTGSGSGAHMAPDTGGGSGGGTLGGSPGEKESYNDRIEGTQKEANREVKRADKKVIEARKALGEAKEALRKHNEMVEEKYKSIASMEAQLVVVRATMKKLREEQAAGDIRMAELKKKLAVFKERDKERAARRAARKPSKGFDTWEDLQTQLEDGISFLKKLTKSAISVYNEADGIVEKASKL